MYRALVDAEQLTDGWPRRPRIVRTTARRHIVTQLLHRVQSLSLLTSSYQQETPRGAELV